MSVNNKMLLVVLFMVVILVGACDADPTPSPRMNKREDESAEESATESTESGETKGGATLNYKYVIDDPPKAAFVLQVEIPLEIYPESDNSKKYIVTGIGKDIGYTQIFSTDQVCFVQCDIPIRYAVTGEVTQMALDEKGNCLISLQLKQGYEKVKAYGSCPEPVINRYDCSLHNTAYNDSRNYIFSFDDPVVTPKDVDDGVTITAEISNVKIPPAIEDTCRWE